jgi:hypothetical protein
MKKTTVRQVAANLDEIRNMLELVFKAVAGDQESVDFLARVYGLTPEQAKTNLLNGVQTQSDSLWEEIK